MWERVPRKQTFSLLHIRSTMSALCGPAGAFKSHGVKAYIRDVPAACSSETLSRSLSSFASVLGVEVFASLNLAEVLLENKHSHDILMARETLLLEGHSLPSFPFPDSADMSFVLKVEASGTPGTMLVDKLTAMSGIGGFAVHCDDTHGCLLVCPSARAAAMALAAELDLPSGRITIKRILPCLRIAWTGAAASAEDIQTAIADALVASRQTPSVTKEVLASIHEISFAAQHAVDVHFLTDAARQVVLRAEQHVRVLGAASTAVSTDLLYHITVEGINTSISSADFMQFSIGSTAGERCIGSSMHSTSNSADVAGGMVLSLHSQYLQQNLLAGRERLYFGDIPLRVAAATMHLLLLMSQLLPTTAYRPTPAPMQYAGSFDRDWYNSLPAKVTVMQCLQAKDQSFLHRRWDADEWMLQMNAKSPAGKDYSWRVDRIRNFRVAAMLSTVGAVRRGGYSVAAEDIHLPGLCSPPIAEKISAAPALPAGLQRRSTPTEIIVVERDCCLAAADELQAGYHPVMLNLASLSHPGGGYKTGAGAQEENIVRRSNYAWTIDRDMRPAAPRYPISAQGGIYSPQVTVFRDSEDAGYAFRTNPFTIAVVGVAAERKPELESTSQGKRIKNPAIVLQLYEKVHAILAIAAAKGHDCIILGALGCGAYGNPPDQVAMVFREVLEEYNGIFAKVVFAIIDDHNARQAHNPEGNLLPFQRVFGAAALSTHFMDKPLPCYSAARHHLSRCPMGGSCRDREKTHQLLRDHSSGAVVK